MDRTTSHLEEIIKKAANKYAGMPIALSGGIDSGLLAALIKPQFAIHVEIPDETLGEAEYVRDLARYLKINLHVIKLDFSKFEEDCEKAFKIIGEPIPHFNIFPLYELYKTLRDIFHVKELVLGDGPDESMCGYARDLVFDYILELYFFDAFENYHPLIRKVFKPAEVISKLAGVSEEDVWKATNGNPLGIKAMSMVNMKLKRPEMDTMSNKLAEHFGITIHRPYQDNKEVDDFMFNLPSELKIHDVEYGKYALRLIAEKYLPKEVAWRKVKVGGPLVPVNRIMGWEETEGKYGKEKWLEWQRKVLNA